MKRIVITGAECTGKSTLAQALSLHYREPKTDEYVRSYVNQIGRQLIHDDLDQIVCGQLSCEDSALGKAKRMVFHDTNLLSSIIYAEHYFKAKTSLADGAFHSREYSLYLLCLPDGIDWKKDSGQRDSPLARLCLHKKFKENLDLMMLPYVEISGDKTTRLSTSIKAINVLFKA